MPEPLCKLVTDGRQRRSALYIQAQYAKASLTDLFADCDLVSEIRDAIEHMARAYTAVIALFPHDVFAAFLHFFIGFHCTIMKRAEPFVPRYF